MLVPGIESDKYDQTADVMWTNWRDFALFFLQFYISYFSGRKCKERWGTNRKNQPCLHFRPKCYPAMWAPLHDRDCTFHIQKHFLVTELLNRCINHCINHCINQPLHQSAIASIKHCINQPLHQSAIPSISHSINQPLHLSTITSISHFINQPLDQSTIASIDHCINRPLHQSTTASINHCINRPLQSTIISINHCINQASYQPTISSINHCNQPLRQSTIASINQVINKPLQSTIESIIATTTAPIHHCINHVTAELPNHRGVVVFDRNVCGWGGRLLISGDCPVTSRSHYSLRIV